MRGGLILAMLLLAACAGEKLALAPPAGVNLSGKWKLNEAESDDPQRLLQSQIAGPTPATNPAPPAGGRGGRGGRGGGNAGPGATPGMSGPVATPPVGVLAEGLSWPGKDLEIKQLAGTAAFTSNGINRVYQPADVASPGKHPRHGSDEDDRERGRDAPLRGRGDRPPVCGWDDKTLVVLAGQPDDDHPPFEERYSLSDDGQRLIEVVGIKGGRSGGYTMFRVWDRVAPLAQQ